MTRRRKTAQAHWPKAHWLEHQLADLSELVAGAVDSENYAAAAALKKQLREVRREIDQMRDAEKARDLPATTEIHLVEMLSQVRAMRSQAQTAGSWVAASNLSKRELELVRELEEHRAKDAEEVPELTLEQLMEILEKRLAGLPPVIQAKLRSKIIA